MTGAMTIDQARRNLAWPIRWGAACLDVDEADKRAADAEALCKGLVLVRTDEGVASPDYYRIAQLIERIRAGGSQ